MDNEPLTLQTKFLSRQEERNMFQQLEGAFQN